MATIDEQIENDAVDINGLMANIDFQRNQEDKANESHGASGFSQRNNNHPTKRLSIVED